jgi:hypothetical protein
MAMQAEFDTITAVPVPTPDDVRLRVEAAIQSHLDAAETLILKLDATDPDADLEDNGDAEPEPDGETDLGWPEMLNQPKALKACTNPGASLDFEDDRADDEPSLGWTVGGYRGGTDDREQEFEDEGADAAILERGN